MKNLFRIEFQEAGEYKIRILTSTGITVFSGKLDGKVTTIDVSDLSKGIYFIHITKDAGRPMVQKILKE